jgi:uncharacterized protein DUF3325
MPDEFWLITALFSTVIGMGWLALAMDVHWKQVYSGATRSPGAVFTLRCLGYGALTTSLVLCLLADTATMAVLVWMMWVALSAAIIAFVLSWRPGVLRPLAFRPGAPARD